MDKQDNIGALSSSCQQEKLTEQLSRVEVEEERGKFGGVKTNRRHSAKKRRKSSIKLSSLCRQLNVPK